MAGQAHFLEPLLRRSSGTLVAKNQATGRIVAATLEPAFDSAARRRGLLGRDGLPGGHCLVIAPCSLVHTFAMRFAIDILFVARDGRVLKVRRAVPPSRIAGSWRAFAVMEMAAGELAASGTSLGDVLELVAP